jgi:diphthamide biosynthesis methyltransferase
MLYLVGLGLSDETDITVKGLEVVKKASRVYLEAYTSILLVDQSILVCIHSMFGWGKQLTLTLKVGKLLWTTDNHCRP